MVFQVRGSLGVAVQVLGPVMRWESYGWADSDEGDWVPVADWVRVRMVGDDRVSEVEVSELVPVGAGEFCAECGQVGCGWC